MVLRIENAIKWLLDQKPQNDLDKILRLHALSGVYFTMKPAALEDRLSVLSKKDIDYDSLGSLGRAIYCLTRLPSVEPTVELESKAIDVLKKSVEQAEESLIRLYLKTLAKYLEGGSEWKDYNKSILEPLVERLNERKAFSKDSKKESLDEVIFSALTVEVYYQYWRRYMNFLPEPWQSDESDIKIEISE